MSLSIAETPNSNLHLRAGAAALAVLLLTSIHHIYGAIIYNTPWRLDIVYVAAPVGMVMAGAFYLGWSRSGAPLGRAMTWTASLVSLAFAVLGIGIWEGGFNHVVKNLIYFTSGETATRKVFAGDAYEMPNDLVFEVTGVAQFPLSIVATMLIIRLLASMKR